MTPDTDANTPTTPSTPATAERKRLTISLTGRPPVTVVEADWPLIARAVSGVDENNQWNRRCTLSVRRHADGRAIVYGRYETCWRGEVDRRAGLLVPVNGDIPAALRLVAEDIGDDDLAQRCVEDMPATPLE